MTMHNNPEIEVSRFAARRFGARRDDKIIIPSNKNVVAIIPARGGSKGIPMKNIKPFCGVPLIAHSIRYGKAYTKHYPDINVFTLVTTDSLKITTCALDYGADAVLTRPPELAQDDTPMWPVLQHAAENIEWLCPKKEINHRYIALLDPTSPTREETHLLNAFLALEKAPNRNGAISVTASKWHPTWHGVIPHKQHNGEWWNAYFTDYSAEAKNISRRQDIPPDDKIYFINGQMYLWRARFVVDTNDTWRGKGMSTPLATASPHFISLDTLADWEDAEKMVQAGILSIPFQEGQ